ncbi:hypothetical protein A2U01_0099390, partial [Trifolium medium]|nr:hypothetical protein [Trifolium medium]
AMLMWVLWNNRNDNVWNDVKESGQSLGVKALRLWSDWRAVQDIQCRRAQPGMQQQQQQITQWQKPQF